MARMTDCANCPCNKWKGQLEVRAYTSGHVKVHAVYDEVGFRGSKTADLMIVGESPGAWEVYKKKPFIGDSGKLVDRVLVEIGLSEEPIFIANACRCMIIKRSERQPHGLTDREIKLAEKCCRPALETAIKYVQPKLIVLFGNVALHQLLKQSGITKKRGIPQYSEEFKCWMFPTYHPAFCLRDRKNLTYWRPDMDKVAQMVRNNYKPVEVAGLATRTVDSIQFLLDRKNFSVALDTETQGNDRWSSNHVVVSYSVSDSVDGGYNIVLWEECKAGEHDKVITWDRAPKDSKTKIPTKIFIRKAENYEQKVAELRELLYRRDIKKYMMTGYDLHQFEWLGLDADKIQMYVMDVQTAAHCLDPDVHKVASLADIQRAFCPERADHKSQNLVDKTDMLGSLSKHPEEYEFYACADTATTLACGLILRDKIRSDKKLLNYYVRFVQPVTTRVLHKIERTGVNFDLEGLPRVKDNVAKLIRRLEQEAIELIPEAVLEKHKSKGIRLSRGDLVRDVLFSKDGFGLKSPGKTATGKIAIGKKLLARVREELEIDSPPARFIELLSQWGPYRKLFTTYLTGFENAVHEDGKLHTQISTVNTATGRTGSRNPNLQNIPKRNKEIAKWIRQLLVAPEGKCFLALDYSQNELRWTAYRSGDRKMTRAYQQGLDLHRLTASAIMKVKLDEVTKSMRQNAKAVNFGLIYGMGGRGFQIYARDEYGVVLSLEEAEAWRHTFLYELYKELPNWHKREIAFARKYGYIRTPFGRIRRTPNIHSQDSDKRSADERIAINTPIQGAGSDTTLFGALIADETGLIDGRTVDLSLFIHDELIFLVDEDKVDVKAKQLKDTMENLPLERFGIKLTVPLVVDMKLGRNLGDMQEYTF